MPSGSRRNTRPPHTSIQRRRTQLRPFRNNLVASSSANRFRRPVSAQPVTQQESENCKLVDGLPPFTLSQFEQNQPVSHQKLSPLSACSTQTPSSTQQGRAVTKFDFLREMIYKSLAAANKLLRSSGVIAAIRPQLRGCMDQTGIRREKCRLVQGRRKKCELFLLRRHRLMRISETAFVRHIGFKSVHRRS